MRSNEILTLLLYGLDVLVSASPSKLMRGGEAWQRYHGLHRDQLYKLQRRGLVERSGGSGHWALALTGEGRLRAIGGRDPVERWGREWDGVWRMVMFDLEIGNEALRRGILRWLHGHHLGCLQRSVWIQPDPCPELAEMLIKRDAPAGSVLLFEGRPGGGSASDLEIADSAWDFSAIQARYQSYLDLAAEGIPQSATQAGARAWLNHEAGLWKAAIQGDPLLPSKLLPKAYLGKKAWAARKDLLRKAIVLVDAIAS